MCGRQDHTFTNKMPQNLVSIRCIFNFVQEIFTYFMLILILKQFPTIIPEIHE